MNKYELKEHKYNPYFRKKRRRLEFVALGMALFIAAGVLVYDRQQNRQSVKPASEALKYSIQQAVDIKTKYMKNSFFEPTPDASNTAYLTDLTDSIDARFDYKFNSGREIDLSYQYQATAVIRALYGSDKTSQKGQDKVWSKEFSLGEPVIGKSSGASLVLNPVINIPYATYYKQMEQFRTAFTAPISSELVVTYTVQLSGGGKDTPIKDTKVSTLTVPLDQQIFQVVPQYQKTSNNEIGAEGAGGSSSLLAKVEIPLAVVLIVLGVASVVFGVRKQLVRTPHQRKLEKIYHYHDGVIIRAKQPPDIDGKNIVVTDNFDDLLILEEQLKTPIIANKVSDFTTHFFVVWGDNAYVHTLGTQVPIKEIPPSDTDKTEEKSGK